MCHSHQAAVSTGFTWLLVITISLEKVHGSWMHSWPVRRASYSFRPTTKSERKKLYSFARSGGNYTKWHQLHDWLWGGKRDLIKYDQQWGVISSQFIISAHVGLSMKFIRNTTNPLNGLHYAHHSIPWRMHLHSANRRVVSYSSYVSGIIRSLSYLSMINVFSI